MKLMQRLVGAAMAAGATLAGAATAQAQESGPTFSGNIALTTEYVFRGVSQSDESPAVQGGFDYTNGGIYAGTWASNIDFSDATLEIDLYGGYKPVVGPFTLDFGFVYYAYPGAADDGAELDYIEGKVGASFAPTEASSLGVNLFYSPEFTGETGAGLYAEAYGSYTFTDAFSASAGVANQSADENFIADGTMLVNDEAVILPVPGPGPTPTLTPILTDSYTTWNVGGTVSAYGFGFDLRYFDTDIDNPLADERVVFTIKRAL